MINAPKDGNSTMWTRRSAWMGAMVAGFSLLAAADDGKLDRKPMLVGASLSFGQMFNINDSLQEVSNFNPTVTLPYTSLWMIQEATYNERFRFNLGIAGTFWYPFPEDKSISWTSYRTGGVAIAVAQGSYIWGDLEKPWLELSVGQQGYKYNPHTRNFGEYLFRSEAFPTTVRTGDWGAIDNAGAGIWGAAFKGNFMDGMLKNDLLVTLANERAPLHDLSFTNITSLNLGGVFQLGGGVMLNRYLQVDPKKSKPKQLKTGWFTWTAADQANLRSYVNQQVAASPTFLDTTKVFAYDPNSDPATRKVDTALVVGQDYWAFSDRPLVKYLANPAPGNDPIATATGVSKNDDIEYIDSKTIFLMGRASLDVKPLFGITEMMSPHDLILYTEISVLGLNNYPIYYEKTSERMPIMVGFYLPTFRLLDWVTIEFEQLKNPHINSDYASGLFRLARPKSPNHAAEVNPSIADPIYDKGQDQYRINHTEDDFKWTVSGLKSFGIWNVAAQVGKDHFRPLTGSFRPSYTEAATTKDAWYYMVRLMVNL